MTTVNIDGTCTMCGDYARDCECGGRSQLEAQGFTIIGDYAPLKYLGGVVVITPNGHRTVVTSVCGHCCHPWSGCVCEED